MLTPCRWVRVDPLSNDWGVISVEDWAEIRRLHRAEGMPIKAIARRLGVGKNTEKRALASDGPPRYQRESRGSAVDAFEPRVRELLAEFPDMPATVIAERVGWTRSITVFRSRVSELRPLFTPRDPASRTTYGPGELAQWWTSVTLARYRLSDNPIPPFPPSWRGVGPVSHESGTH